MRWIPKIIIFLAPTLPHLALPRALTGRLCRMLRCVHMALVGPLDFRGLVVGQEHLVDLGVSGQVGQRKGAPLQCGPQRNEEQQRLLVAIHDGEGNEWQVVVHPATRVDDWVVAHGRLSDQVSKGALLSSVHIDVEVVDVDAVMAHEELNQLDMQLLSSRVI